MTGGGQTTTGGRGRYRVRCEDRWAWLGEDDLVMGRSSYCSFILDHETLSRVHASLRLSGERVLLVDEGSSNGSFVNGARVEGAVEVVPGDDIRLGRLRISLDHVAARSPQDTAELARILPTARDDETLSRGIVGGNGPR
jgi:pSer/pThr/pTyr-binding forkhead associated (FHA) protein